MTTQITPGPYGSVWKLTNGVYHSASADFSNDTIDLGSRNNWNDWITHDVVLGNVTIAGSAPSLTGPYAPLPVCRGQLDVIGTTTLDTNRTMQVGYVTADRGIPVPSHLIINTYPGATFDMAAGSVMTIDQGSYVAVSGQGAPGAFRNDGTIDIEGGSMSINAALTGYGTVSIDQGGWLTVRGAAASNVSTSPLNGEQTEQGGIAINEGTLEITYPPHFLGMVNIGDAGSLRLDGITADAIETGKNIIDVLNKGALVDTISALTYPGQAQDYAVQMQGGNAIITHPGFDPNSVAMPLLHG